MKRKICIVTGARAEYGLFYPLLEKIRDDGRFELQIIATGMHLSAEFGLTYKEIEKDGFRINKKINILLYGDTEAGITKSIGLGITKFAGAISYLKPNIVILLGDRFETFAAAVAAFVARIPIAHIHGGELTEGAMDEAFRHSITKMSLLHFTSTEEYRMRVIQLGESPERVFNVGALGIDNIHNSKFLSKKELENNLNLKFDKKNILVTFHPVTLENNSAEFQFKQLLSALSGLEDVKSILTKANAETDGRIINRLIDNYMKNNPGRVIAFASLGRLRYLSTIQFVDAVAGNSSSGIIEVPSFGKPTVNIGDRQKGRIKAKSIIDCEPDKKNVTLAIKKALSKEFSEFCKTVDNPYGDGHAAERIFRILKKNLAKNLDIKKPFYDIREK